MRRVFFFAALLSLVGLSTAFAASFSTQSEDVDAFSTAVSISVPQSHVVAYYFSGADLVLPGVLSPAPAPDNSVNSKAIEPGTLSTKLQTDATKMHSWQTAPVPVGGLVLQGTSTVRVFQNGSVGPATAGLFVCASATTATDDCTQIAGDVSSLGTESAGTEVPISFGNLSTTVPADSVLRVVIVNLGTKKWNLQWGYKTNRESRLDLSVAGP